MKKTLIAAALLGLAACGRIGLGGNDERTTVDFRNESIEQAAVYVVGPAGEEARIGTVSGGQRDQLTIPDDMVRRGTIAFYARLLARNDRPASGRINVSPGDRVQITLPASLGTLVVLGP